MPAGQLPHHATHHRSHGATYADARDDQAQSRAPFARRQELHDRGAREGRYRRSPRRLQDAPGDEHRQGRGQGADEGARSEPDETYGEGFSEAVDIGQAPVEGDSNGEDEEVTAYHPACLPLRYPELVSDG